MCGIIGFTGKENAVPVLIHGLKALEYRGYDSAGVGFFEGEKIRIIKENGRISDLEQKLSKEKEINTQCGIGHTRWATHGEPTVKNAHPHGTENVIIVHNGIIENSEKIKNLLRDNGYLFESDTDTEAVAKLIDFCFASSKDPIRAIRQSLDIVEGSFAIGALFKGFEGRIYGFRKDNPLIAAHYNGGSFLTSDISAVSEYASTYYEIEEEEIVIANKEEITFVAFDGKEYKKESKPIAHTEESIKDEGFRHYMLKEISEEPFVLKKTVEEALGEGTISLGNMTTDEIKRIGRIHIVACGTSYHAGMIGKFVIEKLARIPVNVCYASEFRYQNPVTDEDDLVIAISQSGETADTLAAIRLAKLSGLKTFAVVNVAESALAREADNVFLTKGGREVSVASTKAYHVQLAAMFLVAFKFSGVRLAVSADEISRLIHLLINEVPDKIREISHRREYCESIARRYMGASNMFFIGRGADVANCMEAALKMKEISYNHCEAYPAGELKHGPISLVTKGVPVVAVITNKDTVDKMLSNIREVKSRGADVIILATESINIPAGIANDIIYLPETEEIFMPFVCGTATQLMAYYTALNLGHDVDKPRNLAKSVTVE